MQAVRCSERGALDDFTTYLQRLGPQQLALHIDPTSQQDLKHIIKLAGQLHLTHLQLGLNTMNMAPADISLLPVGPCPYE